MFRLVSAAPLIALVLAACAGMVQAGPHDPRIVYTRHALTVDVHDLNLSRDADRRVFQARIADAADEVCGGRPDRDNRYNESERELLQPAYEKCLSDSIQRTNAAMKASAQLLAGNGEK
jgi:UrcA family protein